MNSMKKKVPAFILAVMMILICTTAVYAHDVPDIDRMCSVTITMKYENTPVGGGSLSIYKVGDVSEDDGNYFFVPTDEFVLSGESLKDLTDPELSIRLRNYADEISASILMTMTVDETGRATFDTLSAGLYLFVQHDSAEGYSPVSPFLISLPYFEDGEYKYELTAEPKTELIPKPTPPDEPDEPDLPLTGQLWWPVPVFVCAGLVLLSVGFAINRRNKSDEI